MNRITQVDDNKCCINPLIRVRMIKKPILDQVFFVWIEIENEFHKKISKVIHYEIIELLGK